MAAALPPLGHAEVRKSTTGVCHCPGGQWYARTSNYEPFATLEACLASEGREPARGQGECGAAGDAPSGDDAGRGGAGGAVRKSRAGICHCAGGTFYGRTANYTAFESIEACLASGGRHPRRGQGDCASAGSLSEGAGEDAAADRTGGQSASSGRYDRDAFGGWVDADADCQDTRHERLIERSAGAVDVSASGCRVIRGRWRDPYTGKSHTAASEVEIDHVVPLRYAWDRGAAQWTAEKRLRFANDPANLLPVAGSVNASKGARGPLEWLPPAEEFVCEYVLRFRRVVELYGLDLGDDEQVRMASLTAERCD